MRLQHLTRTVLGMIIMLCSLVAITQQAHASEAKKLPEDLQAFKQEAEAAFRSKDMTRVRSLFHPETKADGRNLDQHIEYLSMYVPMFSNWELAIESFREEGPIMILEVEYRTGVGIFPDTAHLKRVDGKWRFYGNRK